MSPGKATSLARGRFELIEHLGRGGSGDVYRAVDRSLHDTELAIKVYRTGFITDSGALPQMKAEIIAARKIDHPNVIRLYEFYENDGKPFLTMEFIPGEPLSRAVEATRKVLGTLPILRQLADALAAVHALGIVHCDLKPGNVMLRPDGTVKLMDFGVAALQTTGIEWQGGGCTPEWAPPELIRGERPTPAVDVYSFGLIALRLLTGATNRDRLPDIANQHLRGVVAKCLEIDPARRYATGCDLKEALVQEFTALVTASRYPRWWLPVASAIALLGLIVLLRLPQSERRGLLTHVEPVSHRPAASGSSPGSDRTAQHAAKPNAELPLAPQITTRSGPMLLIKEGSFRMGYGGGRSNEMPEHQVQVQPFYMDEYEVTTGRFTKVTGSPGVTNPNTPAIHITWYSAEQFCKAIGQRLPTEAEWEFAARGSGAALYPWGSNWLPHGANVQGAEKLYREVAPVGTFRQDRTTSGLYDMLGNVPEWVADDYLPYGDPIPGWPTGRKTVRGAGTTYTTGEVRLTVRDSAPLDKSGIIGFRCAKDLPIQK